MTAAAVLAGGLAMTGAGAPAGACACGGIVSHDLDARVTGEQALVALTGRREAIVMRLDVESVANNAALIVPTPTPATATQAGPAVFPELQRLTAPLVEPGHNSRAEMDTAARAPGGSPIVIAQVQLGPLQATTLTGGDLAGVRNWLDANGYAMRPEVSAQLEPYLRQGWSLVAMRLTGAKPLRGQLDPVRLDFASDRMVYPMRMSAAANGTQHVVTYTLSPHRMQRTDPDAARQKVTVDFAGPVAGHTTDATLTELSATNPYLTKITSTIDDPASIVADFTFGPAPSDEPYQQVIRAGGPVNTGYPVGMIAAAAVAALAAAVAATVLIRRRTREQM